MNKLGIGEICNLRSEFEEIVSEGIFKMQDYESDIDNLYEFIESGYVNNRFRQGFDRALEIANIIVTDYEIHQKSGSSEFIT